MENKLKNGGEKSWEKEQKPTGGFGDRVEEAAGQEQGQIDDLIGNFGRYQLLIFVFKILIGVTSAFNNLGVTFSAPSDFVGYWCADSPSGALHQSNSSQSLHVGLSPSFVAAPIQRAPSAHYQQVFSEFISNSERTFRHGSQQNHDTPTGLRKECQFRSAADQQLHKCSAYRYDTGIWISTIIDEWDLVCERGWLISMTQSLYMSGFIVSFLLFGYLSDRFGRWRSLFLGALIEILAGFGCALAGSVSWFMVFRFLLGLGNAGRSSSSYLIMIEWAGPKWRMHISTLGSLGWMVGYCAMPWITLYFLHFRHMQLFVCFYEMIFLIWLLRLPESPRWLLTHRRFDEAYEVLLMAARFNGLIRDSSEPAKLSHSALCNGTEQPFSLVKQLNGCSKPIANGVDLEASSRVASENTLKPYTVDEFNIKFKRLVNAIYAKEFTKNEDRLSIIDLFKWENLRRYSFILFFVWAANSFIYYGIVLRVGDFGGRNLFVAFTIAGITELPSLAFTILCMKFLPRGTANLFIFSACGLLCALQLPLKYYDQQWLQQSTIMLAKLFNSCAFTCILYQTMELFPTSIRQTAYSSCSLAGRIGSILAPFIKELAQLTNSSVPPVIYATLSFMAAALIRSLPETKGSDLPDTLLEAENFEGTDKRSPAPAAPLQATLLAFRRKSSSVGARSTQ